MTRAMYPEDKDWVTSFTDRDSCNEQYTYESDVSNPQNHYWSTVIKKCEDEIMSRHRYEFWYDAHGNMSRVVTDINGSHTDISYGPVQQRPARIEIDGTVEELAYDYDGLITRRRSGGQDRWYRNDRGCDMPSSVQVGTRSICYALDDTCRVVSALDEVGVLRISYDDGHPTKFNLPDGTMIEFVYDPTSGALSKLRGPGGLEVHAESELLPDTDPYIPTEDLDPRQRALVDRLRQAWSCYELLAAGIPELFVRPGLVEQVLSSWLRK